MAKLVELMTAIERKFSTKIRGDYLEDASIKYIRFLTEREMQFFSSSNEVLFLVDYQTTEYKNLRGPILFTNCDKEIPGAITTSEQDILGIYNCLELILERFAGEEQKKKNLFVLLHQKDGIQSLINEAHETLNLPVTVINSGYTIIGTEHDDNSKYANVFIEEKYLGKEYINRMRQEGIQDKLINYLYPFEVYLSLLEVYAIFCSIRIKNSVVAYIYIDCGKKQLKKADFEYIYVLSQAMSIQLQKDYTYQNPKAIQYNSFFNNLLNNEIEMYEDIPILAMGSSFKKHQKYFFICWSFRESETNAISLNFQQYEITKMLGNSISNIRNKYFVSLVSTDDYEQYIADHDYVLEAFLKMNNMLASISFTFDDLSKARTYYDQAKAQLEYNLYNKNPAGILYYKDYYFNHLVETANNKTQILATINYKINNMIAYDKENHSNYVNTLVEYFKNNRNAPETAKALFIHKSSLFYRFNKMTELFMIDLNDYNECFSYEFSLRVLNLLNN